MIRAFLIGMAGALAVFMGAEVLAHGLGYEHRGGMANAYGTALSQQAVEPASLSRPYGLQSHFAGEQ
jgi:hypothetical protein